MSNITTELKKELKRINSFEYFLDCEIKKIFHDEYLTGVDLMKFQNFYDEYRHRENNEENRKNAKIKISNLTLKYIRNKKLKELNEKSSYR